MSVWWVRELVAGGGRTPSRGRSPRCDRITLARSCSERDPGRTRTKNVIRPTDGLCASSSPSQWTPRRRRGPSATHRSEAWREFRSVKISCRGHVWDPKKERFKRMLCTKQPKFGRRGKCSSMLANADGPAPCRAGHRLKPHGGGQAGDAAEFHGLKSGWCPGLTSTLRD